jgi:hypothetical protein
MPVVRVTNIEFTPEAQRALEERTKAFAEELRLAAIDEAVRRRGSASEVIASDVLRAAAAALEHETVRAYEKKIDALAKTLEEQSARSQISAAELSQSLMSHIERLAHSVGMTRERQDELRAVYKTLQEQNYAAASELRNLLVHQLASLRHTLAAPRQPAPFTEKVAWVYILVGSLLSVGALAVGLVRLTATSHDLGMRLLAGAGALGLIAAVMGAASLISLRIRRQYGPPPS